MLRPWAFTAMLAQVSTLYTIHYICLYSPLTVQIPLALLTSLPFMRGQPGNVVVWVSIILGQPLAITMYMHDYLIYNNE